MNEFKKIDTRFSVAVAKYKISGRVMYVFAHTAAGTPAHLARWRKVGGASAIVVGECDDALRGVLTEYTNKELKEMTGLHPSTLRSLRVFLGLSLPSGRRRQNEMIK